MMFFQIIQPLEQEDKGLFHKNKIHSSLLQGVLIKHNNAYIHKTIGKHLLTLFLFFSYGNAGK
ncbi:hypothetical protein K151_1029 [Proteus hauseri ZMd44]|nr:hypothetical protein K151_1029 [Proteus hauseri ZMd44]